MKTYLLFLTKTMFYGLMLVPHLAFSMAQTIDEEKVELLIATNSADNSQDASQQTGADQQTSEDWKLPNLTKQQWGYFAGAATVAVGVGAIATWGFSKLRKKETSPVSVQDEKIAQEDESIPYPEKFKAEFRKAYDDFVTVAVQTRLGFKEVWERAPLSKNDDPYSLLLVDDAWVQKLEPAAMNTWVEILDAYANYYFFSNLALMLTDEQHDIMPMAKEKPQIVFSDELSGRFSSEQKLRLAQFKQEMEGFYAQQAKIIPGAVETL